MYTKHYDHQRKCWNVFDEKCNYVCSFPFDWEAQGFCNRMNEELKKNA
jgi:hypothetical protein